LNTIDVHCWYSAMTEERSEMTWNLWISVLPWPGGCN